MRHPVLPVLLGAICLSALPVHASPPTPADVDHLAPADIAQAIDALKQSFARPDALSDTEMARATLQGLLDRLTPEVSLTTGTAATEAATPFYSEIFQAKTGYLRPGELTGVNIAKAKQALADWATKGVSAVVLDLRCTPASSDFQAGADLERLFCAKGTEMFSLHAGDRATAASPDQSFSTDSSPLYAGILVVLVDADTGEAPEAVAASLRECAKALVVGDQTAGRAFEYKDFLLQGAVLRVATARVILPDGKEPGENGLRPDIDVALGDAPKAEIMRSIMTHGVDSVVEEHDRPHLNEAALVSGSNPDVDEIEAEESGKKQADGIIDRQLQRALDLVTSISIYQSKGAASPSAAAE